MGIYLGVTSGVGGSLHMKWRPCMEFSLESAKSFPELDIGFIWTVLFKISNNVSAMVFNTVLPCTQALWWHECHYQLMVVYVNAPVFPTGSLMVGVPDA